jgi:hypothetical protein
MTMPDNSQFTEEERTEAFRREVMQQLVTQTRSLDTVKTILVFWMILTIVGIVIAIASAASGSGY